MEKVLECHFGEIEILVVLKSLGVSRVGQIGVKSSKFLKCLSWISNYSLGNMDHKNIYFVLC